MKISDLMIGDWVAAKGIDKPFRVVYITYSAMKEQLCIFGKTSDGIRVGPFLSEEIQSILLTPEILEKNGFKLVEGEIHPSSVIYVWIEGGKRDCFIEVTSYNPPARGVKFLVRINTESTQKTGRDMIHSCDIEYIHQFQHAMKLCNIDKEIVL